MLLSSFYLLEMTAFNFFVKLTKRFDNRFTQNSKTSSTNPHFGEAHSKVCGYVAQTEALYRQ
jgi:hypothetical protein